ncbi:hypothetical protein L9F63_010652, partial [Diploptera punctata]
VNKAAFPERKISAEINVLANNGHLNISFIETVGIHDKDSKYTFTNSFNIVRLH